MTAPFLFRFVDQVLERLLDRKLIEITSGSKSRVIREVAANLGTLGTGFSLISSLTRAFLQCDAVEELYADDDELKTLVGDLGVGWIRS